MGCGQVPFIARAIEPSAGHRTCQIFEVSDTHLSYNYQLSPIYCIIIPFIIYLSSIYHIHIIYPLCIYHISIAEEDENTLVPLLYLFRSCVIDRQEKEAPPMTL